MSTLCIYTVCIWLCVTKVIPEFVSDKDDPPLEQKGGKHLQEIPDTETLQQTVKVHVLQPGVHRSTQSQHLAEQQEHTVTSLVELQTSWSTRTVPALRQDIATALTNMIK